MEIRPGMLEQQGAYLNAPSIFFGKRARKNPRKKVCYYPGSFNPVHEGHMEAARALRRRGFKVVFIPAFKAPHKDPRLFAPFEDRFEMLARTCEQEKDFEVSDVESRLPQPSYTIRTLRELVPGFDRRRTRVPFLIGVDALNKLGSWNEAATLIKKLIFYVAPRNGEKVADTITVDGKPLKLKKKLLKIPESDLSSTLIREKSRKGESVRGLVPDPAADILEERKPYR